MTKTRHKTIRLHIVYYRKDDQTMTYITLAIAVSFDSFTVGMIYGMRSIRLGVAPLLLIMCQSALVVVCAMTAGAFLEKVLVTAYADKLGSIVLILLGGWMLGALLRERVRGRRATVGSAGAENGERLRMGSGSAATGAGSSSWKHQNARADAGGGGDSDSRRAPRSHSRAQPIQRKRQSQRRAPTTLLSRPEKADADASGTISIGEAVFLGFALALDAFGAGIAAAFLHYSIWWMPIIVASFTGVFLSSGLLLGRSFAKFSFMRRLIYAPPVLLITLGLSHLIAN